MDTLLLIQSGLDHLLERLVWRLTKPADPFDLSRLEYAVYCRFIQLLSEENKYRFALSSKDSYYKCLQERGIALQLAKWNSHSGVIDRKDGYLKFFFDTESKYLEFEQKYKRFLPYFDVTHCEVTFDNLHFQKRNHNGEVLPVPRTFSEMSAKGVQGLEDVDHVLAHYHHRHVRYCYMNFRNIDSVEQYTAVINYALQKMPDIPRYSFSVKLSKPQALQLMAALLPPPGNPRLFISYDEKEPLRMYFNGKWTDGERRKRTVKQLCKTASDKLKNHLEPIALTLASAFFFYKMTHHVRDFQSVSM